MSGIVLLIDRSDLSRVVYHALTGEFEVAATIREARVPRSTLLKKRLKRLGAGTLLGQVAFAAGAVPWLRREGRQRRAEILRDYALDDSPIPQAGATVVRNLGEWVVAVGTPAHILKELPRRTGSE